MGYDLAENRIYPNIILVRTNAITFYPKRLGLGRRLSPPIQKISLLSILPMAFGASVGRQ
jgi:hypothetical protein